MATKKATVFRGDVDPVAAGFLGILRAGDLWTDTTGGGSLAHKVRNEVNDGWDISEIIAKDENGLTRTRIGVHHEQFYAALECIDANGFVRADIYVAQDGTLSMTSWDGTGTALASVVVSATGVVMTGLPTADPAVAGALWVDTTGGFNILKVSL